MMLSQKKKKKKKKYQKHVEQNQKQFDQKQWTIAEDGGSWPVFADHHDPNHRHPVCRDYASEIVLWAKYERWQQSQKLVASNVSTSDWSMYGTSTT